MWIGKKKLKEVLLDLLGREDKDISALIRETRDLIGPAEDVSKLKKELAELQLKKTMEEREMKHLVKIEKVRIEIEAEKAKIEMEGQYQQKEVELLKQHHDNINKSLADFQKRQDVFFEQVMKRLPDVNVMLGQKGKK